MTQNATQRGKETETMKEKLRGMKNVMRSFNIHLNGI